MCKKVGTKNKKTYHRKDQTGIQNNERITCKLCQTKHYKYKYHYCIFKPNILDLYCCAGGAAYGYYQSGYNVTGIDIAQRKNYFCHFIQADAIEYLLAHGHKFDFIHASPPCQAYSKSTALAKSRGATYPDLVAATREALNKVGVPYVIENVKQAPVRRDLLLRGEMFDLRVIRERVFEFGFIDFKTPAPEYTPKSVINGEAVSVYGSASFVKTNWRKPERVTIVPDWKLNTIRETWAYAMGFNHYTTDLELSESIPPAYTKFIGDHIRPLLT